MRTVRVSGKGMIRGAVGIAVFLVLAEVGGRVGLLGKDLPLASTVLTRAFELLTDPAFFPAIGATLLAWATGLLVAIVVVVPLGIVLGTFPRAERALRPFVEFMRPIPSIALIPLAILFFQDNFLAEVGVIVYASTWPILLNTVYAVRDVDPLARETLRSFGFGPVAVLLRVSLPSAAPFMLTGVRLAASIGLIVAISTELLASASSGIGTFLVQSQGGSDPVTVAIALSVWTGFVGLAVNGLFVQAGRLLFRWHHARGEGLT